MLRFNDRRKPLFTISIAAEMLDCHPRTLRWYEEEGLIHPFRRNKIRYFSQDDIEMIEMYCELMDELDLTVSGVKAILTAAERFHIETRKMIEELLR